MPPAIDAHIRDQVIKEWLSGNTRDEIASYNGIGAGTVSSIIIEWKKGLDNSEYESIRELAVFSKKEAMHLSDVATNVRLNNYIQKSGANLEQIESFIANIASSNDPQKLIDTANQIAKITTIPLDNIGDQIKRQQEEIRTVNDEIEKAGAVLKKMNVDIQTIDEYKNLKEKLERSGLSMESLHELVSVLPKFNRMGSNPQKIVAYYAHMKSLEKKEWRLKNYCKMWESRAAEYQKIIPMCKHVVSMGIDFPLLLTLETAVIKKVEEEHIPPESAHFKLCRKLSIIIGMAE